MEGWYSLPLDGVTIMINNRNDMIIDCSAFANDFDCNTKEVDFNLEHIITTARSTSAK